MDKSAILRAMRAYTELQQSEAASAAQLSRRTIANAESGTCTLKTWDALLALYEAHGVKLIAWPAMPFTGEEDREMWMIELPNEDR